MDGERRTVWAVCRSRTITRLELGQDRFAVRLHRTFADEERFSDFLIRFVLSQTLEHFVLPRRGRFARHMLGETTRNVRVDDLAPRVHAANRLHQLG